MPEHTWSQILEEEYDLTAGSAHCDRHATATPDRIRYDESKREIIIGSGPSMGIVERRVARGVEL